MIHRFAIVLAVVAAAVSLCVNGSVSVSARDSASRQATSRLVAQSTPTPAGYVPWFYAVPTPIPSGYAAIGAALGAG
jgi:hypothetical protein